MIQTCRVYSNTPFLGKSGLDKVLSAPLLKWYAMIGKLWRIDPQSPENLAKLQEMAEAGAMPASKPARLCHSVEMSFDARLYGNYVAAILDLDGGARLMRLTRGQCSSEEARRRLRSVSATHLFPRALAPEAALSGLYLYFSCWDDGHAIAVGTPN